MDLTRIQVVLRIEPLALRSAVRVCLESDPRLRALDVVVVDDVRGNAADASSDGIPARTVAVEVTETPPRFRLTAAGRMQQFDYHGLDQLVTQVADVAGRLPN